MLNIFSEVVGFQNICARSWQDFGNSEFAEADLYEKYLALDDDIQVEQYISSAVKTAITGGTLNCNRKYKDTFVFKPFATWIGCINGMPRSRDKSYGFFRRWIPISFPNRFEENPQFANDLRQVCLTDEGKSGIVTTCLGMYRNAVQANSFTIPESSLQLKHQMELSVNSIASWIEDCVEIHESEEWYLTRREIIDSYKSWCDTNGVSRPDQPQQVYQVLRSHGCDTEKRKSIDGQKERVVTRISITYS